MNLKKEAEKLYKLLDKRNRLYLKGGNDEKLNDQIRNLQKELRVNEEKK